MKCVSYNIQYGIGLDGRYDIGRIGACLRGADLIALQEVTRNNPKNGGRDMVAEIRAEFPDYFAVYGPNFEADVGSHVKDGRAIDLHFQFGNMILSRWPVRMSRNLLLPRRRSIDRLNLQRGALEALVDTPLGPLRLYSVHLDHRSAEERLMQVEFLRERLIAYPLEGGALSGVAEIGLVEPAYPETFVAMGDFNMLEGAIEYAAMAGTGDHEYGMALVASRPADVAARLDARDISWVDPERPDDVSRHKRIDYAFVSAGLLSSARKCHVDRAATGSDHLPLWVEFE